MAGDIFSEIFGEKTGKHSILGQSMSFEGVLPPPFFLPKVPLEKHKNPKCFYFFRPKFSENDFSHFLKERKDSGVLFSVFRMLSDFLEKKISIFFWKVDFLLFISGSAASCVLYVLFIVLFYKQTVNCSDAEAR